VVSLRLTIAVALVACATTIRAADDAPLSFAFASQAGSGIYSIEGRVVQIYRLPIDFTIEPLDDDRVWGVSLTLPITFGFYDYKAADVLSGEFPSHIGTASVLPGVEFQVRAKKNWILFPHVDVGAAKDFSGDALVWVYDAGLRSVVSYPVGSWDGRAGQELLWAGAAQTGNALTAWYAEAKVGFEFRHVLPWTSHRSNWDIGVFATYAHYFREDLSAGVTYAAPASGTEAYVDEQTEVGFSFGTRPKLAWKKISLPKLGLSYRFGDGVHGVRLIFGEIF
jgi:hypothetical protein